MGDVRAKFGEFSDFQYCTGVEVPWAWERESRGQTPKVSKKSRKSLPGPGSQKSGKKSRKRSEKSEIKSENGFLDTIRTFFETFSDFWHPAPGRLFRDFLAFGPETPSPRSTEPQHWSHFLGSATTTRFLQTFTLRSGSGLVCKGGRFKLELDLAGPNIMSLREEQTRLFLNHGPCLSDTRHFRHFRRFRGSEERSLNFSF